MNGAEDISAPCAGWAAFIDGVRLRLGGREEAFATREECVDALHRFGVPESEADIREVER